MSNLKYIVLFAVALSMYSCTSGTTTTNSSTRHTANLPLENTKWNFVSWAYKHNKKSKFDVMGMEYGTFDGIKDRPLEFSATFSKNELSGKTFCNNYYANYDLQNNDLKITNVNSTNIFCAHNRQEEMYLSLLNDISHYKIDSNVLALYGFGDSLEILFVSPK